MSDFVFQIRTFLKKQDFVWKHNYLSIQSQKTVWATGAIGFWLYGLPWRMGAPLHIFTGIWNCRETPCVARALGSAVNWRMGRRSTVAAESRNHRDLIHGETGNGDPLWGLKPALPVRPIHGGSRGHFMVIWTQFMVIWIHGGL